MKKGRRERTFVLGEAVKDAGLARRSVANYDQFEKIIVRLGHIATLNDKRCLKRMRKGKE